MPNPQPQSTPQPGQQIHLTDSILGAEYANAMQVGHNKDEFRIMFLNIFPPSGRVTGKIITTPGHMKRIARALQENIKKIRRTVWRNNRSRCARTRGDWI